MAPEPTRVRKPLLTNPKVWLGLALAVVALLLGSVVAVYWQPVRDYTEEFIAKAIGAEVNQILVEGAVRTDPAAIHAAIALNKGDSLVGYDVKAARKRLEDLPWVKLASVERRLPSTLKVQVYEHQAFARLAEGGETWVVDKEASRIVPADGGFAELPLLSGVGVGGKAAGLFAMLAARPALLSTLVAATYVGERRWDLTFQGDILVNLPEINPDRALELLITLDAQRQVLTVKEAQIDLRLPDRITLKLPEHIPVESLFPAGTKRDIVKP